MNPHRFRCSISIKKVTQNLSFPEEIKRWFICGRTGGILFRLAVICKGQRSGGVILKQVFFLVLLQVICVQKEKLVAAAAGWFFREGWCSSVYKYVVSVRVDVKLTLSLMSHAVRAHVAQHVFFLDVF